MKRMLFFLFVAVVSMNGLAQKFVGYSDRTTVYEKYQPARITLYNGKVIMQKEANVFLKNGRLLFKKGMFDMVADMAPIQTVEFADRQYVKVDTILATVIDTLGGNRVLCTTTIDMAAYNSRAVNDRVITSLQFSGDQIGSTDIDLSAGNKQYPLVNNYFFEIEGKIVELHERTIRRLLPKKKRERFDFYLQMPEFDWFDKSSLHKILELFVEE